MQESQSKKNIAFLTHGYRNIGGGEYFLFHIITKIDRSLFNPIVFHSNRNKIIENIENKDIRTVNINIDSSITSIFRDEVQFGPFSLIKYVILLIKACLSLNKELIQNKISILYAHDNLSKIITIFCGKMTKTKIVTICHDELGGAFIDRFLLFVQRYFFDRVICVSNCVGKTFSKKNKMPDHISVIYGGIQPNKWKGENNRYSENDTKIHKKEIVRIAIIAVFDEVKGHKYLFEAIQLMVNNGMKNFQCFVVGEGREGSKLREWVIKNKLEKYIIFKGYIPQPVEFLSSIDISIVPSLKESFGMSAIEAMSMEIPVIASSIGGLTEVVEHQKTGILVPPSNPGALANAISHLINNPDLRYKMGKRGRKRVLKNFDIEKNIPLFADLIYTIK
tara:strand:+ start:1998 stop:3173 length:1176 start_codon:yes stop_codon:yes gene_type:complete